MKIKVKKVHEDAVIPSSANPTDAGYDLISVTDGIDVGLNYIEYDTGLSIQPPEGYHTEIFPRSSVSNTDLFLANSIGLVDQGYTGTLKLRFRKIFNDNSKPLKIYKKGDKIGQLVIRKTEKMDFVIVENLNQTERGEGGFGSTGL